MLDRTSGCTDCLEIRAVFFCESPGLAGDVFTKTQSTLPHIPREYLRFPVLSRYVVKTKKRSTCHFVGIRPPPAELPLVIVRGASPLEHGDGESRAP